MTANNSTDRLVLILRRSLIPIAVIVAIGSTVAGCTTGSSTPTAGHDVPSPEPATTLSSAAADISIASCKQDPNDTTQLNISGSILNRSSVTSDYSFVVEGFNGSSPSGQAGVTKNAIPPGLVGTWTAAYTIAGATSGSFTCRVRSVLRTPSVP